MEVSTRNLDEEGLRVSRKPRLVRQARLQQHQRAGIQVNFARILDDKDATRALVTQEHRVGSGALDVSQGVRDLHGRIAEFNKVHVAELRGFDLSMKLRPIFRHGVMTYDLLTGEAVPTIKTVAGVNRRGREYRFHLFAVR